MEQAETMENDIDAEIAKAEAKMQAEQEEKAALRRLEERALLSQALADSIKGTKLQPEVSIANIAMTLVELQRDFIGLEKSIGQVVQHFNQQLAGIQNFMNGLQAQTQSGKKPALVPRPPEGNPIGNPESCSIPPAA